MLKYFLKTAFYHFIIFLFILYNLNILGVLTIWLKHLERLVGISPYVKCIVMIESSINRAMLGVGVESAVWGGIRGAAFDKKFLL